VSFSQVALTTSSDSDLLVMPVIQNNLQYVAASNLDAATFQVTYQMKILTTAFFSVILLRKRLSAAKWFALLLLAVGVAIVQIQSGAKTVTIEHGMQPLKGFIAVAAACFTSGLAGVYFEMVLKNSQGDLWVRNVQLSLFSLLPALGPLIAAGELRGGVFNLGIFRNFGPWAWGTVAIQVFGGLVTALVIKYSDNILKGFATSLSIIISSLASVALFNFHLTLTFLIGSSVVLVATMLYAQPEGGSWSTSNKWRFGACQSRPPLSRAQSVISRRSVSACSSAHSSVPGTPVEEVLPQYDIEWEDEKKGSGTSVGRNLMAAASVLGAGARSTLGFTGDETPSNSILLGALRMPSRTHSQVPSRSHTPTPGLRSSPSMPYLSPLSSSS
jgi:UDP-sugar transporter A1/2/3